MAYIIKLVSNLRWFFYISYISKNNIIKPSMMIDDKSKVTRANTVTTRAVDSRDMRCEQ